MHKRLDYNKIRQLKSDGLSIRKIATTCGCTQAAVYKVLSGTCDIKLADYGLDRRRKLTDEDLEKIFELHAEGKPVREIARQFRVTDVCIRYHIYPSEKKRINDASTARTNSMRDDPDFQEHMRKMSAATQRHRAELIRKIKKGEIQNV